MCARRPEARVPPSYRSAGPRSVCWPLRPAHVMGVVSTAAGAYRLGCYPSSIRTERPAARSVSSNAISTMYSTVTAPPCVTNPGSDPSPPPRCSQKSATRSGSHPNRSSRAGAAPAPSRSPPAKAAAYRSGIASISVATGASTPSSTSAASPNNATGPPPRSTSTARPPKARPHSKPAAPQTPPRQPRHLPHVDRRTPPNSHSANRRLTRERRTDPDEVSSSPSRAPVRPLGMTRRPGRR